MTIKYVISTLLLTAGFAQAQESAKVPRTAGWEMQLFAEHITFDSEAADRQYIGQSSTAFGLNVDYYFANSPMTFGGGVEYVPYSDNAAYSQTVRDNYGDVSSESSDASATALYLELGVNYPLNANGSLFAMAKLGANTLLDSSRAITYCSDCYEEDIDISGGAYTTLQLGAVMSQVELGLQYKYYLSGDIESAIGISLGSHFF